MIKEISGEGYKPDISKGQLADKGIFPLGKQPQDIQVKVFGDRPFPLHQISVADPVECKPRVAVLRIQVVEGEEPLPRLRKLSILKLTLAVVKQDLRVTFDITRPPLQALFIIFSGLPEFMKGNECPAGSEPPFLLHLSRVSEGKHMVRGDRLSKIPLQLIGQGNLILGLWRRSEERRVGKEGRS